MTQETEETNMFLKRQYYRRLEREFENFREKLINLIELRKDPHSYETIKFIGRNIISYLAFRDVGNPFRAKHLLIINNQHHFNFINARSENLSNNIKAVINKHIKHIVNEPEIYDRNIPFIYEMFWVAPIYLDIPQEVLYENINY